MYRSSVIRSLLIGLVSLATLIGILIPQTIAADLKNPAGESNPITLVSKGHLTMCMLDQTSYQVVKTIKMVVTAYSSTPDQTDDTPFITASGKHVEDGIVAINSLSFGTRVRILGKIYTVQDRMHPRKTGMADIWMSSLQEAKDFGVKYNVTVEVLES